MGNMGEREHIEIERKYEVDALTPTPVTFASAAVIAGPAQTFELRATYYDTADFALARARVAVRSRTGGDDAGWHIKVRLPEGVAETEWPESAEMPEALIGRVRTLVGDASLVLAPIATVRTSRTRRVLMTGAAATAPGSPHTAVAEFVDDVVLARDERRGVDRSWREWEVELLQGADPRVLDEIERVIVAAGARASLAESKIGRAMGALIENAAARGASAAELASLAVSDLADRLAATAPQHAPEQITELRGIARNLQG